jgi:uncharacterized protein (DUF362 family)
VFRFLLAVGVTVSCVLPLSAGAQQAADATSTVYFAQDDQVMNRLIENPDRSRAMVNSLVIAVTGQTDLAAAWKTLVKPGDRVGIKVATAGGRYFSSHHGIVSAIAAGLESAGVPRERIIVWDRNTDDLRLAGFLPRSERFDVRAIDPPRGFDRDAQITAPMLGKLMWGDLLFAEKQRVPFGKQKNESDQLSSTSHLARLVSRELTKVINVPVLSDERGSAVAGAIYNMTIPNVDNWRRFTQTEGTITSSPAELYADERIGPKCVLHIMDGLLAQFAGGPSFNPNYSFPHQTIYASKDPVALDSVALRRIEAWRVTAKLPPLTKRGTWIADAEEMGLGNAAESRVVLRQVEPTR